MHIIDYYAYHNRLRAVDPAQKVGMALLVLVLCLALNEPWVGLLAVAWMWGLAAWLAGLSLHTFGAVLFIEFLFLFATTLGVAVSLSLKESRPLADWALHVGPIWVSTSWPGWDLAIHLVTRALGATAAMNFMALTTPLVDLVDLFRRWRVPGLLVDLMTVIYRFIFVLIDSAGRMRLAQASRLGYHMSFRRGMTSAGLLAGRLFIDAWYRSRRLNTALEARGFEGELRVLPSTYRYNPQLMGASIAVGLSLVAVWILL